MTFAHLKFSTLTMLRQATVSKNQMCVELATLREENARLVSELAQTRMKLQSAEYIKAALTTEYVALRTERCYG